jgi:hypothetical protein
MTDVSASSRVSIGASEVICMQLRFLVAGFSCSAVG